MDQEVAVIGEDPFGLVVALNADGQFAGLVFHLEVDFIADGLDLRGIVSGADDEVVGKRGDAAKVKDFDVDGLFGFGGSDRDQPGCGGFGGVRFCFVQGVLLKPNCTTTGKNRDRHQLPTA